MKLIGNALWFIESNLSNEIGLSDIANACCISQYHLLRAFGSATSYSMMSYVRRRRLTEAARQLSSGTSDILTVALESGYNSHEAFTRAFVNMFGVTPKQINTPDNLKLIKLVEPLQMNENLNIELKEPRIKTVGDFILAGLSERYSFETNQGIPMQWQRFGPYIGHISNQVGTVGYGVCFDHDDSGHFSYMAGVEVSNVTDLPNEFSHVHVPTQKYLVFLPEHHISEIRKTIYTIWNEWLPNSDYNYAETPDFERYDERFDPQTGTGIVEIWIPIK